jgi:hypothetical protein
MSNKSIEVCQFFGAAASQTGAYAPAKTKGLR